MFKKLFSFLQKKPEQKPVEQSSEVRVELTLRKSKPVPSFDVEYEGVATAQPNEYGNYLYPPRTNFVVHGINPKTGRKNKRVYEAADPADAEAQAIAMGLVPPFEISREPEREPSEGQESYARNVGVPIPPGACLVDVSALLTRYEEDDYKAATPGFLEYIASKGWKGSALIGYKAMFNPILAPDYIVEHPLDEREKIALFAYCVVKGRKGEPVGNLLNDKNKETYFSFADQVLKDEKLMNSFRRLDVSQYYEPGKRSAIYQATKALK